MLNQNDYVQPRTAYAMPATWRKVMREADAVVRKRVEDGAGPMDQYRLQRRNERMAAYPNEPPSDHHRASRSPGRSSSPTFQGDPHPGFRRGYENSQLPDSRGYFSGNDETGGATSSSDPRGYSRTRKRAGVKTPGTFSPPTITTPAVNLRPTSPKLRGGQPSTKAQNSAAYSPSHFAVREIPPAGGRTRLSVGETSHEIPPGRR